MAEPTTHVPHYVPILKGRLGEFRALAKLDPGLHHRMTPLVELAPTTLQFHDDGEVDPESLRAALAQFVERLSDIWPYRSRIIVDAGAVPPVEPGRPTMAELTGMFVGRLRGVVPTVRPSDTPGDRDAVREAIIGSAGQGACIRLAGEDLDDTDAPVSETIGGLLDSLRLAPGDVDLVVDLGSVSDERSATFAGRVARLVLADLPHVSAWRTVVVAGGAFPSDLGTVPPDVPTELPRVDVAMWKAIRARWSGRLDFGDYGIAHPVQGAGAAFAPAPQLRYTARDSWVVMKGRRNDPLGSRQFYEICARLQHHPAFTPGLSWGDEYIVQAASPDPPGPGNAMVWRAIGTSHHLAFVLSRLASGGAP